MPKILAAIVAVSAIFLAQPGKADDQEPRTTAFDPRGEVENLPGSFKNRDMDEVSTACVHLECLLGSHHVAKTCGWTTDDEEHNFQLTVSAFDRSLAGQFKANRLQSVDGMDKSYWDRIIGDCNSVRLGEELKDYHIRTTSIFTRLFVDFARAHDPIVSTTECRLRLDLSPKGN